MSLDTDRLLAAATKQIGRLREQPPIPITITAEAAMILIGQLQLALRHPGNQGSSADETRGFIVGLRRQIAAPGDPLDALIEMGFNSQFDVPWDEDQAARRTPPSADPKSI